MSALAQDLTLDAEKKQAFAERMIGNLNGAGVMLMTSIGHRTGLFDTLSTLPPSTSAEVAAAAGLDERYVREWLGAMVTGGVVEYEPEGARYRLPEEHAAWLTRAATPNNLAVTAQFVSILAGVEDAILERFREGGGLPYSAFPRFHEVMAEESAQTVVAGLLDAIVPLVPGLADRLRAGIDVLDVGCGRGRALCELARTFPRSRFVGYDISEDAVAEANANAASLGLRNLRYEARDAAAIRDEARFDLVTAFDAIHDQAAPDAVLAGIARALREDGVFLMQDIAGSSHVHKNLEHPVAPFLYTISCLHCMTVSLAAGGAGLGTMWGEERALEMLGEAGFGRVDMERLEHDFMNCYYVARKK